MYRRYYSYNDMPEPVRPSPPPGIAPPKGREMIPENRQHEGKCPPPGKDSPKAEQSHANGSLPERKSGERNLSPDGEYHGHNAGAMSGSGRGVAGRNFQTDDLILILIVAALLLDGCDDKVLLAALGFVFLSGM